MSAIRDLVFTEDVLICWPLISANVTRDMKDISAKLVGDQYFHTPIVIFVIIVLCNISTFTGILFYLDHEIMKLN